jgi:alpha-tubulin suppressor-like RCC1 family protein
MTVQIVLLLLLVAHTSTAQSNCVSFGYTNSAAGATTGSPIFPPVYVTNVFNKDPIVSVAVGFSATYFLTANGSLFSAGQGLNGKLGTNSTTSSTPPVYVRGDIKAIAAGFSTGYAINTNGTVFSWGAATSSALAQNTAGDRLYPQPIVDTNNVIQGRAIKSISGGQYTVMLLSSDGMLFTFGKNSVGQIGDGSTTDKLNPVSVVDGYNIIQGRTFSFIHMSLVHAIAITTNGSILTWGSNQGPGIGRYGNNLYPGKMDDPSNVATNRVFVGVAGGLGFTIMLTNDGKVFGVGDNQYGQLCTGTTVTADTPVAAHSSLNSVFIVKVRSGTEQTYLLTNSGTVYGCGYSVEYVYLQMINYLVTNLELMFNEYRHLLFCPC